MSVSKLFCAAFASLVPLFAQDTPSTPLRVTVSIGHFYTEQAPILTSEALTVIERVEEIPVTRLVPLRGPLEIFLLIDHCSSCEPGTKFDELRRFITSQLVETSVGVAYIRQGRLEVGLNPTRDHERAVKALNAPEGGKPTSPFPALADLIRQWTSSSARRAVVMISNGLDPAVQTDRRNPAAEDAVNEAIRAGIPIFAMYHPSSDYATADWSKLYAGQVQLAHVAAETGGEAYFLGFGPMPTLAPFLSDIADHLANQYTIEFVSVAAAPGSFEDISVKSGNRNLDVTAPSKVWVPLAKTASEKR